MKWATPASAGDLQARTGQDVRGDGDRTRPGQPGADDARPLRQRGPFEHRDGWYRKVPARPPRLGGSRLAPGERIATRLSCARTRSVPS